MTPPVDDHTSLSYKRRRIAEVTRSWCGNMPAEQVRRAYAVLQATGAVELDPAALLGI